MVFIMWINKIKINNFRNYEEEVVELSKGINLFYGDNAQGKTNIIEAIFLSGYGKSFRTNKEKEMIRMNEQDSIVEINYKKIDRDGKIKIHLGNKKEVWINGIKIKKLSELLGNVNIVIFHPDDISIFKGNPQNRRRFLDIMISGLKPNYMHHLNLYLKTLEQRNNYLKQIKEENKDENLLDIWDEELIKHAIIIYQYRKEYIDKIRKKIKEIHSEITNEKEKIEIYYLSECETQEKYRKLLKERRKLDIIKGFTTKGIHRDDFNVELDKKKLDIYGSQGQHRTTILSLKLAELKIVEEEIGEKPILLLDDFMSELDNKRIKNFLDKIEDTQVIITCTEKINIENKKILIYNVKEGKIHKEEN